MHKAILLWLKGRHHFDPSHRAELSAWRDGRRTSGRRRGSRPAWDRTARDSGRTPARLSARSYDGIAAPPRGASFGLAVASYGNELAVESEARPLRR
jgi:hypothetical protein